MGLSKEILARMMESMVRTRKFEEKLAELFAAKLLHGTTHLYIGEEAVAAGVCAALEPQDVITSTHRGHGHCIARGMDLSAMMAEFFGKETGISGGRGGSMHMADMGLGILGTNGVVGGGHGLAVGAALAAKMKKQDRVVACFFGDGASNEGSFHEAANLAAVWELPLLFICENNGYGLSMPTAKAMNVSEIAVRAGAYGFEGKTIDGNDAAGVYREALAAREYVAHHGPMLLECRTYRVAGHSKSDKNVYRSAAEIEEWKKKDPIPRLKAYMLENGFSTRELVEIEEKAQAEIERATEYAANSPCPDISRVTQGVYAEGGRA